nr:hypothetical protein [Tanacetum cinerariifolium]
MGSTKVELNGKIVKEEDEAVKRIKGEALKEKDDPGAFIFLIKLEGREEMKKVDKGITMINHTQAEAMGMLTNVLCQVGVTTIIAKFIILDIPTDRDAPIVVGRGFMYTIESDSDDEEEYQIKRNKSGAPIYGLKPAPYLTTMGTHDDEAGSSRSKRFRQHETIEELLLPQDVLNRMGCDGEIDDMLRIRLRDATSDEEIFTSVAWIRAFNINKQIYTKLCHEFYSAYEFDKVCTDDELLGLYQAAKLDKEGFNVYFERGLLSDKHFNAQDYWTTGYDKIQKNDLWLLSMFHARHQNGYANVALLTAMWMKRKGVGTQKESQIWCGQFILKIARKSRVLTDDVLRSLSAPVYCIDLDTTTLKEFIDSKIRLIPKDP